MDKPKAKRRRRNDQQGRNFTCGCGKSYLSYPALYTHIKTKHNGHAPNESSSVKPVQREKSQVQQPPPSVVETEKNPMENLCQLLDKIFPSPEDFQNQIQLQKTNKMISIPFKQHTFSWKNFEPPQVEFLQDAIQYWNINSPRDQPAEENGTYATSIQKIMGRFLIEMFPRISERAKTFLTWFMIACRAGINQQKNSNDYCKNTSASNLPLIFNQLPFKYMTQFKTKEDFLNDSILVVRTLMEFGTWVYCQKYTNLKLRFNII